MALPAGTVSPSGSPSVLSAHLQADAGQRNGSENSFGLSKEQLERRERSLQTLRDLERLFLRSGAGEGHGHHPGFSSTSLINNNNPDRNAGLENSNNGTNPGNGGCCNLRSPALASVGRMKRYEESQAEPLGGPPLHSLQIDVTQNLQQHPQHQLSSPGVDMGPFYGVEGLTPEQMVWRKLQEEYYLEKRRHQEMQAQKHPQHFRMMSEMNMHGGGMMVRGPPPPYHSKPGEQQWGPGNMMGGGMSGNPQMMSMQQEGHPRFLGPMQRGALGRRGFPGTAGAGLSMECPGPQKPVRPGMIWLDDIPNNIGGGGRLPGCYPSGPEQFQGDPEHLLTQEEMFCLMQKREMQGLPRVELERLSKLQQHGNFDSKVPGNAGEPDLSHLVMVQGPPSARVDPMGFTGSQQMMTSPGGGHQRRDMVESVLRNNLTMNPQMNVQQQQMSQKLREGPAGRGPLGEMFSQAEMSQIKAAQNARGGNRLMVSGPDGCFDFPNQGLFSGGQLERPHLQQSGPGMFRSEQQGPLQKGATSRLCHMSMAGRLSAADLSPRHPSDPSLSIDLLTSPSMPPPPHQLKSPSLNHEPSPCLPSPSVPGLKSPSQASSAGPQPPLPPASGAGTPSSSSIKSPQLPGSSNLVLHSPSASPGHLKSPAVTMGSPGWSSPKTAVSSPAGPTSGKLVDSRGRFSTETFIRRITSSSTQFILL